MTIKVSAISSSEANLKIFAEAAAVVGDVEFYPHTGSIDTLNNVLMTPHMSGWTSGTVRRRQETLAENIGRLSRGEALVNVLHGPA